MSKYDHGLTNMREWDEDDWEDRRKMLARDWDNIDKPTRKRVIAMLVGHAPEATCRESNRKI